MAAAENVPLQNPTATVEQNYSGALVVSETIDGTLAGLNGWGVSPYQANSPVAVWETTVDQGFPDAAATVLTFTMTFGKVNDNFRNGLGKFRLSATTDDRSTFADGLGMGGDVTAIWTELIPGAATASNGLMMSINLDNTIILVGGADPLETTYVITALTPLTGITGFRLETFQDGSLPANGPGRAEDGNFVLSEFRVDAVPTYIVVLQNPTATFEQLVPPYSLSMSNTIDHVFANVGLDFNGWAISPRQATEPVAVWETAPNQRNLVGSAVLTFTLTFADIGSGKDYSLGKFRLSATTDDRSEFADGRGSDGDVTANWTELTPLTATAENGPTMTINPDNSILVSGTRSPTGTVYTITAETGLAGITGFRLETFQDSSLPGSGPGRFDDGNFLLTEFQVNAVKRAVASGTVIVIR
jgi:hypothetical protein